MKVVLTGASGLIGKKLVSRLQAAGHEVLRLVRRAPRPGEARWDPERGELDPAALSGVEAAVHLAGESVGEDRWTREKKARIVGSRVRSTRLLSERLAELEPRPRALVSASGVGFYGDAGDALLDEASPLGRGFLAEVCRGWEEATEPAAAAGVRVVRARIGVVLSVEGGALARLLPVFRAGAGGPLGDGRQYMSWVTLDDAVEALVFCLEREEIAGAVNVVAPGPVTSAELGDALGRALHRPALLRLPRFAARLALGAEKADELLFTSARVAPTRLLGAGFEFRHPALDGALEALLGRDVGASPRA